MNTCGTCKHFGAVISYYDDEAEDMVEGKYHKCELLKHMNGDRRDYTGPAGVIDGSGYHATMCVSEEFGCNQHEVRDVD